MVSRSPFGILTLPPGEYDQSYFSRLVESIQNNFRVAANPGEILGSSLALTDLPQLGAGLSPGDVFSDDGVLKIVREDDVFAGTFSAAGAVGTVTITIS